MKNLTALQNKLGYQFSDESLLECALTHRSKHKSQNNERLEFLGDAVLSLVISTALFERHPGAREGELSRLRAALVKGETIAKLARKLGLDECVKLGIGELKSGGSARESILAGAFEGVLGAVYRDSDFITARDVLLGWYGDLFDHIHSITDVKDAKSKLQEYLQARYLPLPTYEVITSGRAHAQTFDVVCKVEGLAIEAHGQSSSRRKAEQIAAKEFLDQLNDNDK